MMVKQIILAYQAHINPLCLEVYAFLARQVLIVRDLVPVSSEKIVSPALRE